MEIRHLKTFLTVARLLSFSKAADRLHYAQSSVSAQVRALEEELGVRLFDRLGRRILLTHAGDRLVSYAERITDLTEETRAEIGGAAPSEGSLTIRVPESLGVYRLPSVIYEFSKRFPGIRLNLISCASETLEKELRDGAIDLAFLLAESHQGASLAVEALGTENLVLVVAPGDPLARKKVVRTRDLAKETLLLSKVDCSYRRLFERILADEGIPLEATRTFHSVQFLKRCVMAGSGITILPEVAVSEDLERRALARLRWEEGDLQISILMIWCRARWVSPTLRAFIDITREELTRSLR